MASAATSQNPGPGSTKPSVPPWDPLKASLAEHVARSPEKRAALLRALTDQQCRDLRYHWPFWARPNQLLPPGLWQTWAIVAGRGYGKTRTGAETVRYWAETLPGCRIALVGRTAADVRDVMIKGESGILGTSHPEFRPHYEPSKCLLTWPNGSTARAYSAEDPDVLRGPQHHKAWADEMAAWRFVEETWTQLQMGLRLRTHADNGWTTEPQTIITTTPRPLPLLRELLGRAETHSTRGSTFENRANLPKSYIDELVNNYLGTRIGRQELLAEIFEDVEGALWTPEMIDKQRWRVGPQGTRDFPRMGRVVVGVDPAITQGTDRDETGIVVCGRTHDKRGFVLGDWSVDGTPEQWGTQVLDAYDHFSADAIVVETNRGGDLVMSVIRQACQGGWLNRDGNRVRSRPVPRLIPVHASRGKGTRAEPIVAMYERGRIYHAGTFPLLEDQMCTWVPGVTRKSPDRLDAMVWAFHELFPATPTGVVGHRHKPAGW